MFQPPRPATAGISASRANVRCGTVVKVEGVNATAVWLRGLPLRVQWAITGAASAGVIGAIAGLVIGLNVYAPTAAFAVVELGLPAAIVGAFLGLAAGVIVSAGRRIAGNDEPSR